MEITYQTNKIEKNLTDYTELSKAYGTKAKNIKARLEDLLTAENLETLRWLPAMKCHELTGNRKGELSIYVSGNYRLVFEPANEPVPRKDDGGLDWSKITKIKILSIEDYH